MLQNEFEKTVIGWREFVGLPDWNVKRVRAKADTGAKTSAIDVADLQELEGDRVRFTLVVDRKNPDRQTTLEAPIARRARVRSAHQTIHERIIVRTTILVGTVRKQIEIGLVCRKRMLCRMLLGRTALTPEFIVDSGRRYVAGGRSNRKHRSSDNQPTSSKGTP